MQTSATHEHFGTPSFSDNKRLEDKKDKSAMHYRTPKHSELLMKIIYLSSVGIPYCGRLWARRHSKYCVQEFFLSHE